MSTFIPPTDSDESTATLESLQRDYGFGHDLLEKYFLLRKDLLHFNHGSFGTVPRPVMDRHIELMYEQESCPEIWFREKYFEYVKEGREKIASLIHGRVANIVLVENASTAVNAILRSFPFAKGDVVIVFSSAYRMVKDTLRFQLLLMGGEMVEAPLSYDSQAPLSAAEIIESFSRTIEKHGKNVKLCVFSHISSMVSEFLSSVSVSPNNAVIVFA